MFYQLVNHFSGSKLLIIIIKIIFTVQKARDSVEMNST